MASLAEIPEVVGFFSYSRDDDEAYAGRLSALRAAIQHELSAQLGRSKATFRLWQDKESIAPGRLWETEITNAVEQSVFFIPIVTPRAVNSQYCQFEFDAFLARERELGRTDLVFPIFYVPVPALASEAQWRSHPVLSVVGRRQYVDWQTFRFSDSPTPAMREAIAGFASKIVEALHRSWVSPEERKRREEAAAEQRAQDERRRQEAAARQRADEEARRRNDEAQAQRLAEERLRQEAESRRRADELERQKQADDEARRRAEDERSAREAEAERCLAEERLRQEAESKRRADELERREQADAETRRRAEDERSGHEAEAERPPAQPPPPPRSTRRAMLLGGGALGAGAIAAAAVIARQWTAPSDNPIAAPPASPAVVTSPLAGLVTIGLANPLTGVFAALGANEQIGCQLAIDQLNARNGILGRRIELIAKDTPDSATASQNARALIQRDKVDLLVGNVISAAALAMNQVSNESGVLHIVPGAHVDSITGSGCKWNVFRVCHSTRMEANAICPVVFKTFGRRWHFITADFALARAFYQGFEANLKRLGGTVTGNDLVPLGTADFSAYLAKARAANPDFLFLLVSAADLLACLRQIVQSGLNRQVHVGGNQLDLEFVAAMAPELRVGAWMLEWYWKQPAGTPGLEQFVSEIRRRSGGKAPTAHTWFGYVTIQAYALACERAQTTEAKAVARALSDLQLPPEIRLQPNNVHFRSGDHQLMLSAFIGDLLQTGDGDAENLFKPTTIVPGDSIAPPVGETGCQVQMPA